jgi:hypothetical protein
LLSVAVSGKQTKEIKPMKQAYKIVRNSNGDRAVRLDNGKIIPAGIAGLCVGADRWLSEITCKCRDCGEIFSLRELGEVGQWCESCSVAEIA